MSKRSIVIIGGGANGVSAFIHLVVQLILNDLARKVTLTIIEKTGAIGEGLAFGTKQPGHLLNTQAGLMGIFVNEPSHYSVWLEKNKHLVDSKELKQYDDPEESFTTRRLYSHYLRDCFAKYVDVAARCGIDVQRIHGEATHIVPEGERFQIKMDDGVALSGNFVILAPGTPKPDNYSEFNSNSRYIDFPWPSQKLLNIPGNASVAILGTSLSAIDAVMTLVDNGHKGEIRLFSPDGLLPRVQPKEESQYTCEFLTTSKVHEIMRNELRGPKVVEVFRLFQQEVHNYLGREISWKDTRRQGKDPHDMLLDDIKVAEEGGDAFINVLYATREASTPIWEWFSADEKQRFKQWLGTEYMTTRHAMPLHNARRLKRLFDSKKLFVHGNLEEVKFDNDRFVIHHGGRSHESDMLVNATGPANHVKKMKSTLINNLVDQKMLESYPAGGVCVNTTTMQVQSSGRNIRGLYAVGHLANGMLLDVNAVWFNVRTIGSMTKHIISELHDGGCR